MRPKNKKKKHNSTPKKRHKTGSPLTAATADPLKLYEASVQSTETSIGLIDKAFNDKGLALPLSIREDFCGSAKLCADWTLSHPQRTAVGVDIDEPTILWAKENNIEPIGEAARRVKLLKQDVLNKTDDQFDVVIAFNFSYWVFQQRRTLKTYFKRAMESLNPGGMLIIDLHGGPDSQYVLEEEIEQEGFTYVWDQKSFDPINNRVKCHIHFRFDDDTEIKNAFTYDWRIWSLPELRDLLEEVGFSIVDSWWDGENDIIRRCDKADSLISWIAYLVAWR